MKLSAHGLGVTLPRGWEGTIIREDAGRVTAQAYARRFSTPTDVAQDASPAPATAPVAQFATFPLPPGRDDFGGGAVERMGPDDVFITLLEYDREEVGSALFSDRGLPRRLDPRAFSPQMLHRRIAGHAGLQLFFNDRGRAFCLYIVLGDADDAHRLVRRAEQVLATVDIDDHTNAATDDGSRP